MPLQTAIKICKIIHHKSQICGWIDQKGNGKSMAGVTAPEQPHKKRMILTHAPVWTSQERHQL